MNRDAQARAQLRALRRTNEERRRRRRRWDRIIRQLFGL